MTRSAPGAAAAFSCAAAVLCAVIAACSPPQQTTPPISSENAEPSWVATTSSLGPVRIGMTVAETEAALRSPLTGSPRDGECVYLRAAGVPEGVLFMYVDGALARIDVTAPGVATDTGMEVGATEDRVREAYRGHVSASPHKYTDGRYLTVTSDADHLILFETDGGTVTRYRVGRLPEVEWVEGCA